MDLLSVFVVAFEQAFLLSRDVVMVITSLTCVLFAITLSLWFFNKFRGSLIYTDVAF